jgi:protein transport protein SEC61 subunit beta
MDISLSFVSSPFFSNRGIAGAGNNILQFYTDDSPGLQVGPTTVLVASLSFVGVVVLLHIWGKFRM